MPWLQENYSLVLMAIVCLDYEILYADTWQNLENILWCYLIQIFLIERANRGKFKITLSGKHLSGMKYICHSVADYTYVLHFWWNLTTALLHLREHCIHIRIIMHIIRHRGVYCCNCWLLVCISYYNESNNDQLILINS